MNDTRTDERAFEADLSAIGAARSFATSRVSAAGDLADTLALVTSELASNAVLHAGTPFVVRVERVGDDVRVAVFDGSSELPTRRPDPSHAVSGRGLSIVEALAATWGVDVVGDGKWVWAVVEVDGGAGVTS